MNLDCVVLGAGVIGLAIARHFALQNQEVVILDKAESFGTETSSRNSEVIHAGIYYPKNSLKAKLCLIGKEKLYQYCAERSIAHQKIGKIIVATQDSELDSLYRIEEKAKNNGVLDLKYLSSPETQTLEPNIIAIKALFSPSTGIINSHAFMLSLLGDAEQKGAMLAVKSSVIKGIKEKESIRLFIESMGDIHEILAKTVINATGLHATIIANAFEGYSKDKSKIIPRPYYCKGNYFTLKGRSPFRHLIYPIPDNAGLGIHVTLDLSGQARFGPDTEWIETPDYSVNLAVKSQFCKAIQKYYPNLIEEDLLPGYTGIRPKVCGPEIIAQDFIIQGPKDHGLEGLVNLFGIESPGLTAALAIAEYVYVNTHQS